MASAMTGNLGQYRVQMSRHARAILGRRGMLVAGKQYSTVARAEMPVRRVRWLILIALLGVSNATPAGAQIPPPKKESELIAAGTRPMTGQQISAILLGNTAYGLWLAPFGRAQTGSQFTNFFRDARTRVLDPGTPASVGVGKHIELNWWLEGNLYCAEYQVAVKEHVCASMYQVSSAFYACIQPSGDCSLLFRVVPGNPGNL